MKHEPMSAFEEAMREALKPRARTYKVTIPDQIPHPMMGVDGLMSSTMLDEQHQADPIFTPIFLAIFGTSGFTIFGTFVTWASIATAIATTALTIGLQLLLMKPPKPDKVRQPLVQAIPPRFYGVGEVRISGALMLWEAKGTVLFSVQAICGHPINAYKKFFLHDDQVTRTGVFVNQVGERYAENRVAIYDRVGSVPGLGLPEFVTLLADPDVWSADHRGDGQAFLGMTCLAPKQKDQRKRFPYGPPVLSTVAELALCWDFRDPDQDPDDPSTWVFTRNPVVHLAWHECFNPFGSKRDYRTAILPVLDMWQEEADVCDEPISLAVGGTEPRYRSDGQATTDNDPKVFTNALLAAMDGWMCDRGDGALLIVAGKFREKYVATLTDADIVGHSIQYDVLPEEEINRLIPRFNYPATDYVETDTDYFEDTAAQLEAGRVLARNAEYDFVTEWRQARRLGKRDFARIREKIRGRLDLRLTGINAVYAPWVRLDTPKRLPALDGALFSNRRAVVNLMKGGFSMDVIKMPADIDAWNPATDEGSAPPIPAKPDVDVINVPEIDTVQARVNGSSVYLLVVIIDPDDESLTPMLRWRVKDTGSGSPGAWTTLSYPEEEPELGYITLTTGAVPADTILEVQACFLGTMGQEGSGVWTEPPEEIDTTIDTVAPLALTAFAVTGGSVHMGHAPLSFTTANDPHLQNINIYRVPKGVTLNKATHFAYRLYGVPTNATFADVDGDDTRTNLLLTPDFASDTNWTKGAGFTISGGKAHAAAGSASNMVQAYAFVAGTVYRNSFLLSAVTGGNISGRFFGTTTATPVAMTGTNGRKFGAAAANAGNNQYAFNKDASFAGDIDEAYLYVETAECAPQGDWDYYACGENPSGIEGPTSGPLNIIIV